MHSKSKTRRKEKISRKFFSFDSLTLTTLLRRFFLLTHSTIPCLCFTGIGKSEKEKEEIGEKEKEEIGEE